jgi:hypothetical protein
MHLVDIIFEIWMALFGLFHFLPYLLAIASFEWPNTLIAGIVLHNIPEGMAVFLGSVKVMP